jgi:hypothetical protein
LHGALGRRLGWTTSALWEKAPEDGVEA